MSTRLQGPNQTRQNGVLWAPRLDCFGSQQLFSKQTVEYVTKISIHKPTNSNGYDRTTVYHILEQTLLCTLTAAVWRTGCVTIPLLQRKRVSICSFSRMRRTSTGNVSLHSGINFNKYLVRSLKLAFYWARCSLVTITFFLFNYNLKNKPNNV